MSVFLVLGYLATLAVMLSFFWVARAPRERDAAHLGPEGLAMDREDQDF
jgi:hypothetical protein